MCIINISDLLLTKNIRLILNHSLNKVKSLGSNIQRHERDHILERNLILLQEILIVKIWINYLGSQILIVF